MPTTPNPTLPGTDPGTGDPTDPNATVKPAFLNVSQVTAKSAFSTANPTVTSTLRQSPYSSATILSGVANVPPLVTGVSPGRYSRRMLDASTASTYSGGTGWFGKANYAGNAGSSWWSTNFIDSGDTVCSSVAYEGSYYSQRTVSTGTAAVLMGVCTIDSTNINLFWGNSWSYAVANSLFDDGTNPYTVACSLLSDGTVDVTQTNLRVMKACPARGAFVMLNLSQKVVYFAMLDGESLMIPGTTATITQRSSASDNILPLSSTLTALPTFQSGVTVSLTTYSGAAFTLNMSLSSMDYSRAWLQAFTGYTGGSLTTGTTGTSLAAAQSYAATYFIIQTAATSYVPIKTMANMTAVSGNTIYSGWLRPGTSTQMVGWFIQTNVGNNQVQLLTTAYGFNSLSPFAMSNVTGSASNSVYNLTSSNTQAEICANAFLPSTQGALGFMFDASVGSYGQVRWLSQI